MGFAANPLTGAQSALNYGTNLARNGVSGMYTGQTTGGMEQANYARNLNILGANGEQAALQAAGPGSPAWENERLKQTMFPSGGGAPAPRPAGPQAGGGIAPYSTSITPGNLYSPAQTASSVSQAAGQGFEQADPFFAMKQFDRPGLSRDAGTMSAAMPGMAQGVQQARNAQYQIPIQDALANNQFKLQGQQAQGQEGLQLAGLLRQLQNTNQNYQMQAASPLLQMALGSI